MQTAMRTKSDWRPRMYGSGTCNVEDMASHHGAAPWLYVVIVRPVDDDAAQTQRFRVCEELAAFLGGGPRPAWLDDMERTAEDRLDALDGLTIEATGPVFDADPPNLNWRTREDADAVSARARLIDRLWLTREGK